MNREKRGLGQVWSGMLGGQHGIQHLADVDAHSQVIAAEYHRLLRGVQGASTGEVCSNIQGRRSVVK